MSIYTKTGDDGTTGLFFGGRVAKDATAPEAYGTVDELVSALGTARAITSGDRAADILALQRELFVVGAELATAPENHRKLEEGTSRVTAAMVERLETRIDEIIGEVGAPTEFVVPGGSPVAAALDHARSVARRAERRAVTHVTASGIGTSFVVPYLNRLNDLLYMLARAEEREWVPARTAEDR